MGELLPSCYCGNAAGENDRIHGVDVVRCDSCGVVRQKLKMAPGELAEFYANKYHGEVFTHTYQQDREAATLRLADYGNNFGGIILDVGCSNGAFVDACRNMGYEAYGVDIGGEARGAHFYRKSLDACAFPTEYFDSITLHDVLEHVVDPTDMIRSVSRIVKDGGKVFVDLPDFFSRSGEKHWKHIEHLWFWDLPQIVDLFESMNFRCKHIGTPVPGKKTFIFEKGSTLRKRILVPPGIGDILWVMTKLRAFIRQHDLGVPEIWVDAPDDHRRSQQFVESIPFVKFGGYHPTPLSRRHGELEKEFARRRAAHFWCKTRTEVYKKRGESIFPGFHGYDWLIGFNGCLNNGASLEEVHPELEVDWDIPFFDWRPEWAVTAEKYVVASFFDSGFYKKWIRDMNAKAIYDILVRITAATDAKVFLCGAEWDSRRLINRRLLNMDRENGRIISFIGKTTFLEYMALLKGATGCFGFPAGNTMIGPQFNIQTGIVWNDHFPAAFFVNTVKRGSMDKTYHIYKSDESPKSVADDFISKLEGSNEGKTKPTA